MKILPTKNKHRILVDNEDYQKLVDIGGWYVDGRGYAITDKVINGKRTIIDLHRLVHPPKKGFIVDHINQNKLDNRKSNLRDATKSLNALNSGMFGHNRSGYKGVCWSTQAKKWRAYITHNNKQIHLGYFIDIKQADKAYRQKLAELLSEVAHV
jgi:hypothetical protein